MRLDSPVKPCPPKRQGAGAVVFLKKRNAGGCNGAACVFVYWSKVDSVYGMTDTLEYKTNESKREHYRHSVFLMIPMMLGMSLLYGITAVIALAYSLPKTDGAYGVGLRMFGDPLVVFVMIMFCGIGALICFPWYYFLLRDRDLWKGAGIASGITLIGIIAPSFVVSGAGTLGALAGFFLGVILARQVLKPIILQRPESDGMRGTV